MQYAIIKGKRSTAKPKLKAVCGHCGNDVQAKCGSKIVWHWAHVAIETCDSWREPETLWHRNWKNNFGVDFSEIAIIKEGKKHIADVLTKKGLVIEFQNSPISSETIVQRELFYGKMIWVMNGESFKSKFATFDKDYYQNWKLKLTRMEGFRDPSTQRIFDAIVVRGIEMKKTIARDVLLEQKFIYLPKEDLYCCEIVQGQNFFALEARIEGAMLKRFKESRPEPKFKALYYEWSTFRKSWADSKAPIFIDFNENFLVLIKTGIGNRSGEALKVLKKDFLEKYVT